MSIGRLRATDYLLWIAALAWPLGVFTQLPIPGVGVLTVIAFLLAVLVVPDTLSDKKLHVPFEVLAPAAIIAAIALIWSWTDPAPLHRNTIEALSLFVLVVQAAPSRDAIRRYLFASMLSLMLVTIISLVTPWLGLIPTAFSLRSGASFTFPYTLGEGAHELCTGAALAIYIISDRRFSPAQRACATASLILIATLTVGQSIHWFVDTRTIPVSEYLPFTVAQWIAAVLTLWLIVRVIAKIEIDRRAEPDPLHRLWWMLAPIAVFFVASGTLQPRPYQGLLLGFACATALPARLSVRAVRWPVVGSVVLCALFAANLLIVFPANVDDPRQYDAAAQHETPFIFDRMDWVDRHAPNERRTYLWRARAALNSGLPSLASFAFERAASLPEGRQVLATPSNGERQQFLVDMRDAVATIPEDRAVCAYERVLLANGERDSALYSLRLQTSVALMHSPAADASLFAPVVALILGDSTLVEDLRTWDPDEVLTLLSHWGTDAAFAVDEAEAPGGVFILAAQRKWKALDVLVRVGEKVTRFEEDLAPVKQADIVPLTDISAMVWAGPGDAKSPGIARYTLNVVTSDGVEPAAYIDLRADGSAGFEWAKNPPVIEYTPAVRIRLAK